MKRRFVLTLLSSISIAALTQGCAVWPGSTDNISALFAKADKGLLTLSDYDRGKHYVALGDYGLAIEAFNFALAKDSKSVPALNGLAVAYDRIGRGDVAQSLLAKAFELDPRSPSTLNNLAYLHLSHGEKDEAAIYFARAKEALAVAPPSEASVKLETVVDNNSALVVPQTSANTPVQVRLSEQGPAATRTVASSGRNLETDSAQAMLVHAKPSSGAPSAEMPETRAPLVEPVTTSQLVESQTWNLEVSGREPRLIPPFTSDSRGNANLAPRPAPQISAAADHQPDQAGKALPIGAGIAPPVATEPLGARVVGIKTTAPIVSARTFPPEVTVRIANLTNRHNMAHRFQHYFDALGVPVHHLVNESTTERRQSAIYYSRGQEKTAEALARLLPISVRTIGLSNDFGVIELMLAPDLEPFDRSLVERRSS